MLATLEKWVEGLVKTVAILGGIVLAAIAIMTAVSIIGRALLPLGLRPVPGDFELVEAGTAFVVTAFFPWCQLRRGHASVSILTDLLGMRTNLVIDLIADALLLFAAVIMTWRHIYGMLDKQAYGETTFILQFPLWWAYALCVIGLVTWVIAGLWAVVGDIRALMRNQRRVEDAGAIH